MRTVLVAMCLVVLGAACTKPDAPPPPSPTQAAELPPLASESAAASAEAPPSASAIVSTNPPMASATPPSAPASAAAPGTGRAPGKGPKPAPVASAAATCGDKPLPDCPLKKWMKDNTAPAMASGDFDALATAFGKIVTFAPAGYANWASISKDGAAAARAASADGVKAACRSCHEQYKQKYKDEIRARPLP